MRCYGSIIAGNSVSPQDNENRRGKFITLQKYALNSPQYPILSAFSPLKLSSATFVISHTTTCSPPAQNTPQNLMHNFWNVAPPLPLHPIPLASIPGVLC
ncbi:hypothetical protein EYC84_009046 [Monilinia fructicola]|uniref:Uncharacterized protein n=1 Tax=Monilinia fructicola TaxID=38448 RepID=A0A5M9JAY9_MONFR|nr:hypothetical protein EYC84_009046 [Monilinia fructicola]